MQKEKLVNRILIMLGICAVLAAGAVIVMRSSDKGTSVQFITYATVEPTAAPEITETPEEEYVYVPEYELEPEATTIAEAYPGFRSCTVSAVGNITVSSAITASVQDKNKYDFEPVFTYIKPYIERSDLTLATVTGPMGGEGTLGYSDYPQYNVPESLIGALKDSGIGMLALSNRHSLDTLFDGFKRQIDNLGKAGMGYFGGAASAEEKNEPVIRELGGIKVGFLNYTDSLNGMDAYSEKAALEYGVNTFASSNVKEDVKKLHAAGAEVVMAYVIWGSESDVRYTSTQKEICKRMADAGVDVIFGAGPQAVQPVFKVSGKGKTGACVCVCSMGNFLSSNVKDENGNDPYADSGILLTVTLQETDLGRIEVLDVRYMPTYVWHEEGGSYRVLCAEDSLESMPQGMSEPMYQRMNDAYQETLYLMAEGIGVNDVR